MNPVQGTLAMRLPIVCKLSAGSDCEFLFIATTLVLMLDLQSHSDADYIHA